MCLIKEFLFYWVRYYYSPTLCANQHERQQQLQRCGWIPELALGSYPLHTGATNWGPGEGGAAPHSQQDTGTHTAGGCRERKQLCLSKHSPSGRARAAFVPHCPRAAVMAPSQCPSCTPISQFHQRILEHRGGSSTAMSKVQGMTSVPGTAEPWAALELGWASCSSSEPPWARGTELSRGRRLSCTVCQYLDGSLSARNYPGYFYTVPPPYPLS